MKHLLITAAVLALSTSALLADDADRTIRMSTAGGYPPYNFINDQGEVDGYERELGDELCARAELTCEWVLNDWDSIIPNLVSGNYDTIMAGMSITDERDEVIDFTQNYFKPAPSIYVATSGDTDPSDAVIAVETASLQASHVATLGGPMIEFPTINEAVSAVRSGEADAVFAERDYVKPLIEAANGELVVTGEPIVLGQGVGIGVRESDAELKEKLNAGIAAMKEDGTLNELLKKWFGDDVATY